MKTNFRLQNLDSGFDCYSEQVSSRGFSVDIIDVLQQILMFSVTYKIEDEIRSDNDADVIAGHPPLQSLDNVDLLFPTLHSRLVVLYKKCNLPAEKDLFVRNITGKDVWLYLVGTLILLAVCFRLSTYVHSRLKPKHIAWSWMEVMQWTVGAVCQQGSDKLPQGCSCRTMFLIGYFITYLIFTGYAAGITSLLAVRSETQELMLHKTGQLNLPFTTICGSDGSKYVKSKTEKNQSRSVVPCVNTMQELVSAVYNANCAAVVSESTAVYYLTSSVKDDARCDMAIAKQPHFFYYSGLAVERGSVLKKPFNYWLLRLKEHGLLKRLLNKSLRPLPLCKKPPGYTEVGFEHVRTAFGLILFHMLAALILLCLEILVYKKFVCKFTYFLN